MPPSSGGRSLWQDCLYFGSMIVILVFANWSAPNDVTGLWYSIYSAKWIVTAIAAVAFAVMLVFWLRAVWWHVVGAALPVTILALLFPAAPTLAFAAGIAGLCVVATLNEGEMKAWLGSSWGFAKQMLPLLLIGVLLAGVLLGRPGQDGLIPSGWIAAAVGGNSLLANFVASFAGAFMYFATLTEVPIIQGLIGNGMGKGPALALLLAGPALSLPNMLVIRSVMGTKRTAVFIVLTVMMATASGVFYGALSR
jgi:uncharacterized membrane protein YraQ (UPF0718 family)